MLGACVGSDITEEGCSSPTINTAGGMEMCKGKEKEWAWVGDCISTLDVGKRTCGRKEKTNNTKSIPTIIII